MRTCVFVCIAAADVCLLQTSFLQVRNETESDETCGFDVLPASGHGSWCYLGSRFLWWGDPSRDDGVSALSCNADGPDCCQNISDAAAACGYGQLFEPLRCVEGDFDRSVITKTTGIVVDLGTRQDNVFEFDGHDFLCSSFSFSSFDVRPIRPHIPTSSGGMDSAESAVGLSTHTTTTPTTTLVTTTEALPTTTEQEVHVHTLFPLRQAITAAPTAAEATPELEEAAPTAAPESIPDSAAEAVNEILETAPTAAPESIPDSAAEAVSEILETAPTAAPESSPDSAVEGVNETLETPSAAQEATPESAPGGEETVPEVGSGTEADSSPPPWIIVPHEAEPEEAWPDGAVVLSNWTEGTVHEDAPEPAFGPGDEQIPITVIHHSTPPPPATTVPTPTTPSVNISSVPLFEATTPSPQPPPSYGSTMAPLESEGTEAPPETPAPESSPQESAPVASSPQEASAPVATEAPSTTASEATFTPVCTKDVDVVLVVDGSTTIGIAAFEALKQFLHLFVASFSSVDGHAQVGIVHFSSADVFSQSTTGNVSEVVSPLTPNRADLGVAIDEMLYGGGRRFTAKALEEAVASMAVGRREGVPAVYLVITDGFPADLENLDDAATKVKADGRLAFTVVGVAGLAQQLGYVVSSPYERNIFIEQSYEELRDRVSEHATILCD